MATMAASAALISEKERRSESSIFHHHATHHLPSPGQADDVARLVGAGRGEVLVGQDVGDGTERSGHHIEQCRLHPATSPAQEGHYLKAERHDQADLRRQNLRWRVKLMVVSARGVM